MSFFYFRCFFPDTDSRSKCENLPKIEICMYIAIFAQIGVEKNCPRDSLAQAYIRKKSGVQALPKTQQAGKI